MKLLLPSPVGPRQQLVAPLPQPHRVGGAARRPHLHNMLVRAGREPRCGRPLAVGRQRHGRVQAGRPALPVRAAALPLVLLRLCLGVPVGLRGGLPRPRSVSTASGSRLPPAPRNGRRRRGAFLPQLISVAVIVTLALALTTAVVWQRRVGAAAAAQPAIARAEGWAGYLDNGGEDGRRHEANAGKGDPLQPPGGAAVAAFVVVAAAASAAADDDATAV